MTRFASSLLLVLAFLVSEFCFHTAYGQWTQQRSGTLVQLNDVVMLDSLTAIAIGDGGRILRTTDAGARWIHYPTRVPLTRWNAIAFGSRPVGAIVGDGGMKAFTTNAGESWFGYLTRDTAIARTNLLSVAFVGPNIVFIGNDSGEMFSSTNGGKTWRVILRVREPITDIFFSTGPSIWGPVGYALTPHRAYRTTNLGTTWRPDSLPIPPLSGMHRGDISENVNAYAVGFMGDFTTTPMVLFRNATDSLWRQWMFMPPLPIGWMNDVSAPAPRVAYVCGTVPMRCISCRNHGMLFKTTDAGHVWQMHYGFRRGLNAIDFFNARRGFVVGDSGAIFFTANGGGRVLNAFKLLSPRNGDTLRVGSAFSFQWERSPDLDPDTTWHQVYTSTLGPEGPWEYQGGTVGTTFGPQPAPPQGQYWWIVRATDGSDAIVCEELFSFVTQSTAEIELRETPTAFALHQNYPNPFNPSTTIRYELPKSTFVKLNVFNLLGQEVATLVDEAQGPGFKSVQFGSNALPSGVYVYRIEVEGFSTSRKLLLLR